MEAVARQRCLHHSFREAVARCPDCGSFFCRECIAEHDDRIICAACLKKLAQPEVPSARRTWNLWPISQLAGGFFLAWVIFYATGQLLLLLPAEFHDDRLWKATFMNAFQGQKDE